MAWGTSAEHIASGYRPAEPSAEGYRLQADGRYAPIAAEPDGSFSSAQLGLRLKVVEGRYEGDGGLWLRWTGARTGAPLPTGLERADDERKRADDEHARRTELETKLAQYEKRFGKLPEG